MESETLNNQIKLVEEDMKEAQELIRGQKIEIAFYYLFLFLLLA